MKKIIVSTAILGLVGGVAFFGNLSAINEAHGQGAPAAELPHKVGLIDMGHVVKNYKKFTALHESLKKQIEQSDGKAKETRTRMLAIQEKMKGSTQGSADYIKYEKQLLTLKSDLEAYVQGVRRDLMRSESQIYKTVYVEVADAVKKYAYHYKYTLVMRFDREELQNQIEYNKVARAMNRQVVYHRSEDDITLSVLNYLNSQYRPAAAAN